MNWSGFDAPQAILQFEVPKTADGGRAVPSLMRPLKHRVGLAFANLVLLTSEAVANTVTWANPRTDEPTTVRVAYVPNGLLVEVTDRAAGLTAPTVSADLHELRMWRSSDVSRFARAWGVRSTTAGRIIWFEL